MRVPLHLNLTGLPLSPLKTTPSATPTTGQKYLENASASTITNAATQAVVVRQPKLTTHCISINLVRSQVEKSPEFISFRCAASTMMKHIAKPTGCVARRVCRRHRIAIQF